MENLNPPTNGNTKTITKSNIPYADTDFGAIITTVAAKWMDNPQITLLWIAAEEFSLKAASFNSELNNRQDVGSYRPQITDRLKQLDKTINATLPFVKGYLLELYKDAAKSYYPSFGIEHKTNKYVFPTDRNKKSEALRLMINAINTNELNEKEFGTVFWTTIKSEYDTLIGKAITTDGTVSTKVSSKNELKKELKKVINSLIQAIRANYPDTYKAELRNWGFQKEKY